MIPEILLDGFIYLAVPPRYKVEWGKDNYKYLADDTELEEFKKNHSKFVLSYFKGLGEMDPQELGNAIMKPSTRKIEQVIIEDKEKFNQWIQNLMGKDSKPKHNFVFGEEE